MPSTTQLNLKKRGQWQRELLKKYNMALPTTIDPRQKAMQSRMSNYDNQSESDTKDESSDFDVINNLVADAESQYTENGGSLKQAFLDLAQKITQAANGIKGTPGQDNGQESPDNSDDY